VRALDFFSQSLRQHLLVEREVGDEPFQPAVFFLQLPETSQLAHTQMRVLLFPRVEGGVTHPELPVKVADRGPASTCRIADTICSSENFDRFIGPLLSCETAEAASLLQFKAAVVFREDVTRLLILLQNPYSDQLGMDAYAASPPNWGKHLAVSCSS
jgi:hypothetical protein